MAKNHFHYKQVADLGSNVFLETSCYSPARNLFEYFINTKIRAVKDEVQLSAFSKEFTPNLILKNCIENMTHKIFKGAKVHSFIQIKSITCHSAEFNILESRNNSFVMLSGGNL